MQFKSVRQLVPFTAVLGAVLLPVAAHSQVCSFTWNNNTACSFYRPCVDSASFGGVTIQVPSNVTRIAQGGLKICLADTAVKTSADIIYIVDMSRSMCACYPNTPGDPYNQRAAAVRAGYMYQRDSVPDSRFGYIAFSDKLVTIANYPNQTNGRYKVCFSSERRNLSGDHLLAPTPVNTPAGQSNAERVIGYLDIDQRDSAIAGTNYEVAFTQAVTWFRNATISPNPKKAIVFITDGEPNLGNHQRWVDSLARRGIPVYGVYLGNTVGSALTNIADQTGGYVIQVRPDQSMLLASVVRGIVREINEFAFDTLSVSVGSFTSQGIRATKNPAQGTWEVTLDSIVPLQPGLNTVRFYARFAGTGGGGKVIDFTFTINASGPPDPACYGCVPATTLELLTTGGASLDSLNASSTAYVIRLTYYGGDITDAVDVTVRTRKGDIETVRLTSPTPGPGGSLVFQRHVSFAVVDMNPATPQNGVTEALASDTVWARWHHPRDTFDRASDFAPVLAPPNRVVLYSAAGNPASLTPYDGPPTVLNRQAGVAIPLYAKVFRSTTWLPTYETDPAKGILFSWEVRDQATGAVIPPAVGALSATSGANVTFTPYRSGYTLNAIVTFAEGSNLFRDTVRIFVMPGGTLRLVVEASPDSNLSRHAENPIDVVQLLAGDTTRQVYGILRDQFGNFAGYASSASWLSRSTAVCTVFVSNASIAQATIRRIASTASQTQVVAVQGSYRDSTLVVVENVSYRRVRIVVNQGGLRDIDTLRLRTDSSATLLALGQRSDNGQWEQIPVTWHVSSALPTFPGPPGTPVNSWTFSPTDTGRGRIFIKLATNLPGDTARDTTVAIFMPGYPATMTLYRQAGAPGGANTAFPVPPAVDTVRAGQSVDIYAKLFDSRSQWLSHYESSTAPVTWSRVELSGNPPTGTLTPLTGSSTRFTPTRAYNTVDIMATFSEGGIALTRTVRFYVVPDTLGPMRLVIEASPLRTASPNADAPLASVTIGSSETESRAYAILRDRFGNFIRPAANAVWTSQAPAIVETRVGIAVNGEGIFIRRADQGQTDVIAQSGSLRDTIRVILSNTTYDSLRIVDALGNDIVRDTIRTDLTRTYYVIARRTDNGEWDDLAVNWRTGALTTAPLPPAGLTDRWTFQPTVHNQAGRVIVSVVSGEATLYDSVFVVTRPGLPRHLVLFPATGTPYQGSNQPYPAPGIADTIVAGTSRQYVAKVFDHQNVWLNQYESPTAPVSWQTQLVSGPALADTLAPRSGYLTVFAPVNAHTQLYIRAVFSEAGIVLRDTVQVYVKPAAAHHLVIEASPDRNVSPLNDNPINTVTLSSRDTIAYVYAIIRDRYGNWVACSNPTTWGSLNTAVAEARGGVAVNGEGAIIRVSSTAASTQVYAYSTAAPSLADTIMVEVSDITYDSLRIVVMYQGRLTDLDTLRIRTDQDTTLRVLGRRSDNRQWDNVRVPWTISGGLTAQPAAPGNADTWTLRPTSLGTGVIRVSRQDGSGGTIRDSIVALFLPGRPHSLVLYPSAGQPDSGNNVRYPAANLIDTVTAGDSIPLVAKIFDHRGVWLREYESSAAPIRWSLVELAGIPPSGTLAPRDGFSSRFVPQNAFTRVYVIATYTPGGFSDTVQFHVRSGAATHLVLEASSDPSVSPNADNPIGIVTVGQRDTVANVYAILRDQFGNFVGYGQNLEWASGDTLVAAAGPGNTVIGQGRIIRRSAVGDTTFVFGRVRNNPALCDTVTVVLATVTYDSLQIVDPDGNPVSAVTTRTDSTAITLMVKGKRSDNGQWEYVAARWFSSPGLSLNPAAPALAAVWTFSPGDTGRGYIRVSLESAVRDSVPLTVLHGLPSLVVLYPQPGAPSSANAPLPATTTVAAGDTLRLVAKVFDHRGVWLSEYETPSAPIAWRVEETAGQTLRDSMTNTLGFETRFPATHARRTVRIITQFRQGLSALLDTILVNVTSGPAHHLVLESDQAAANYDTDHPVDTITLTLIETYRRVYAVVRDRFGNFVGYSQRTIWSGGITGPDTVVTIAEGIASIGEGVITKVYNGADTLKYTTIQARSLDYSDLALQDSTVVCVMRIYFEALRIARVGDTTALDSLVMFTDDDTTLRVLGRRNDTRQWVEIPARWEMSKGLSVWPLPPELAATWRFSPTRPDTSRAAWIRVTLDVDSVSIPDTLPVVFKLSPPSVVVFDIVTPPNERIAGDTIVGLLQIRNRDGLIPGTFCVTGSSGSFYWSNVALPARSDSTLRPVVTTSEDSGPIGTLSAPETGRLEQCFENGLATVRFVLYYAPYGPPDTLAQVWVNIAGAVGTSPQFRLLPARLARMILVDNLGTPYRDTLVMTRPSGQALFVAMGYDIYGNKRGKELSSWTTTGGIPPVSATLGRQVYYVARALDDDSGFVKAQALDTASGVLRDSVFLRIVGPPPLPRVVSATTRDTNGNGLLDRIDVLLKLVRLVRPRLPQGYAPARSVTLNNAALHVGDTVWFDTIRPADSTLLMYLPLREDSLVGDAAVVSSNFQTGWQPLLTSMDRFGGTVASNDSLRGDSVVVLCADGAGPVIVCAVKRMPAARDRTRDEVTVVFSEPVYVYGGPLTLDAVPDTMLDIWSRDSAGYTTNDSFLAGIPGLTGVIDRGDTMAAVFMMTNGQDLNTGHYVSLDMLLSSRGVTDSSVITDKAPLRNPPHPNNRKAPVRLLRNPPQQAKVGPNPGSVALNRSDVAPGIFRFEHDPVALQWVRDNHSGVVITFPISLPLGTINRRVSGHMRIYDMTGNLVQTAQNPDLMAGRTDNVEYFDIFWNGTNSQGLPVAPGVYRYIIELDYDDSYTLDTKLFGNIGIRR